MDEIWVNPIGGLGDMLMLSGVLLQAKRQYPERSYKLIRRTRYRHIFEGHPALDAIDYAPAGCQPIASDYWSKEPLGPGSQRAYQILGRAFGLAAPIAEELYLPFDHRAPHALLDGLMPDPARAVIIAPHSDSPRKMTAAPIWHDLAMRLRGAGYAVYQVGTRHDRHIRPAASLLGMTSPRELVHLVDRAALTITADSYVMHAAALAGKPACVLWGPTSPEVYGYPFHEHLINPPTCGMLCIGPQSGPSYPTPCPHGEGHHCMNRTGPDGIFAAALRVLTTRG